ncbi:hypothetical protein [Candidatus Ichthyocystis sparus]|uniref:hypothetical protein n=1 Tax=Candidatus Ichthyocystis sparus TaxID=1561004 RepID=UPI000B85FAEE|nr:hypothetical protein [Candidatus Ichthyocystis sparus]
MARSGPANDHHPSRRKSNIGDDLFSAHGLTMVISALVSFFAVVFAYGLLTIEDLDTSSDSITGLNNPLLS